MGKRIGNSPLNGPDSAHIMTHWVILTWLNWLAVLKQSSGMMMNVNDSIQDMKTLVTVMMIHPSHQSPSFVRVVKNLVPLY